VERATGIEPVLPTWESEFSILYFQDLQNRSAKMSVHALHTVHALPDLRIAGGRLGDGFLSSVAFTTADLRILLEALPEWYKPRVRSFIIILAQCRFAE
jgi:hypothetical protein